MDFEAALYDHARHIVTQRPAIKTEEAAKQVLVLPLLTKLGYDVHNAMEVVPEYVADIGMKQGEKVDYAIVDGGDEPIILIECKKPTGGMGSSSETQLGRYFNTKIATRFGILTDGIIYNFYSDIEKQNVMDSNPFYVADLAKITEDDVKMLSLFRKGEFNEDLTLKEAEHMKYTLELRPIIRRQFEAPDAELVRLLAKKVYTGKLTKKVIEERFTNLVIECLNKEVESRARHAIEAAEAEEKASAWENNNPMTAVLHQIKIDEGLDAITEVTNDIISSSRITYRSRKHYCVFFIDNNQKYKQVARLYYNDLENLALRLYDRDGKRWGPLMRLSWPTDIRDHAEPIRNIISSILARDAEKQG